MTIAATAFCGAGVPNLTPFDFAAASPSRVRSEINSRSRWATRARIPTVNLSALGQSQQTKSIPLFWSLKRNSAFLANRSSLAITSRALCRLQYSNAAASWGRFSEVFFPVSTSENS
jgi:hypothetical protein